MTTEKKNSKSLFDFVNAIQSDQRIEFFDNLTEEELKLYKHSRYMINRFISMNPNYAPVVNAIQKYTGMTDRAHYLFLTKMLPKKKQYNKYIKGSKDDAYADWMIDVIVKKYNVSKKEAIEYLEIYHVQNKSELRSIFEAYGVDPKLIKKAKL